MKRQFLFEELVKIEKGGRPPKVQMRTIQFWWIVMMKKQF